MPAQNGGEYSNLVAQAKADLNLGNVAKALEEAQQAEKLDSKGWEAYVVAGAAQELQKVYDAAVDRFTNALTNAPEDKRAAIKQLLLKCMQEEPAAASSSQTANPSISASDNGPSLVVTMLIHPGEIGGHRQSRIHPVWAGR